MEGHSSLISRSFCKIEAAFPELVSGRSSQSFSALLDGSTGDEERRHNINPAVITNLHLMQISNIILLPVVSPSSTDI